MTKNNCFKYLFVILLNIVFVQGVIAKGIEVSSQLEFDNALKSAIAGDEIIWKSGMYSDIFMNVKKDNVTIKAKAVGETIFTGKSRLSVEGSNVKLVGFQFLGGDVGRENVIQTTGSDNLFLQINVSGYKSYKYLIIKKQSQRVKVSYCNFENRLNLDDQNIVSVIVNKDQPGFHKIEHCSFRNFSGEGKDMGIEALRIGVSSQKDFSSKTIVEYCYFTQCSGDGEIISNKSTDNVIRYNTFEDNPVSELVLRHGNNAYVYGNFFLNGKGGVRIREGKNHAVFNNYFSGLKDRSITVQSTGSSPVNNVTIAYNTFVETAPVKLGGPQTDHSPKKVDIINNVFYKPTTVCLTRTTGLEFFSGNTHLGKLGVPEIEGMIIQDPLMEKNELGYHQITFKSPTINASSTSTVQIITNRDLDVDCVVDYDVLHKTRPKAAAKKDLGCWEFQVGGVVSPLATKTNSGPTYLRNNLK